MSTITLRYVSAMPLERSGVPRARRRALGIRSASTASGHPEALLDLRDDAVRRIEELGVHLGPAADVSDREELRPRRELRLEPTQHVEVDGTEAVLRPDRLRRRRVEPLGELRRRRLT